MREAAPANPAPLQGCKQEHDCQRYGLVSTGQLRNQHRVTVEGEFGRLVVEVENVPSENPRTGKLSYLSAIAMLRELGSSVQIGN